jgi:hypothetical protein
MQQVLPATSMMHKHTQLLSCLDSVFFSLSDSPALFAARVQGATRSLVAPISKGCDWGQDVPAMLGQLPGLRISSQQRHLAGTLVSLVATKQ